MLGIVQRCYDACQAVYNEPQIIAGPEGRDGASVLTYPTCRVLAFRGTLTEGPAAKADWLNDFHADRVTDDRFPGRVHAGFLSSVTALGPSILGLAEQPADGLPLLITGHSKGGALAVLAGWLLRESGPVVVTFAAPRCGDSDFAAAFRLPCFRFENRRDLVPSLPPVFYSPAGCAINSPAWFSAGEGLQRNHSLETGYKPWVM